MIAYDGVYTSKVPLESITGIGNVITGASRIDLAVKCDGPLAYLKYSGKLIAEIKISATSGDESYTPFCNGGGTWTPRSPHHPTTLQDVAIDPGNTFPIGMTASQINGAVWDPVNPLVERPFDSVQEWTLSGTNAHPYHQHLYHMQPQQDCGHHKQYEWYDTIAASGDCVVRFHMADIGGRCVFHCHVLSHEDSK